MTPPKPVPRADRVSLWRHLRLFRADILSAQPARLFRARMAEFRTPFLRSVLVNDPALVRLVLEDRPSDFPKSGRVGAGLRPLLGRSVFVTNGAEWERQRRIIDPAFAGGRLGTTLPAIWAAAEGMAARLAPGVVEVEAAASHAAADAILRTLFSTPIEDATAAAVFAAFRAHQRTQPLLNAAAFLPLPRWLPVPRRRATRSTAAEIRRLIAAMTRARADAIAAGTAPDDLATQIMTTPDPLTGQRFGWEEMVDQVAIFFLAGHETSASALAWALYLLASHPEWQDRVADEARGLAPDLASVRALRDTRDVWRETLRLYPPVPMMVRETTRPETFRGRDLPRGTQVVVSPWHLHRHERHWDDPDGFRPDRWREPLREPMAYVPFSRGPRICPGAGFANVEGVVMLALVMRDWRVEPCDAPLPVAHLTIRSRDGIRLAFSRRAPA